MEWGFGSYRTSLQQISFEKIELSLLRSITLRADTRQLLHCSSSAAMFTKKLRFGSYRTIVLSPKQPSFEKIVALVFHSTNLTIDGSRLLFW